MNNRWTTVASHAALAAVFFFVLQRYILKETVDNSILWALIMALAAGLIAWRQASK